MRRPLLLAVMRPWFDPRPGELRGLIVLLTVALAMSLALWFDASRRPSLDAVPVSAGPVAPTPTAVTVPGSPGAADGSDGWGMAAGTTAPLGPVVHVSGAVREPGVVTLPEGSRVADAVAASGGAMPDARLDRLNLARRVDDGERIHVTRVGEDAPPPDEPASRGVLGDGRIDLNAASQAELETLPGVGPARARAIIAERDTRPFRVPGDLRRVPGIGEATFQRLAPLVAVR
jgi:competence protein ComEA